MSESNIQQNQSNHTDEIDIFEFCARMGKAFLTFLAGIKDFFISIIIFLIRKSLWIFIFTLVGMLSGFFLHRVSKPTYSSTLEGNTGGLDNMVVIDHVNKLNQLSNKPALLANYLNITEEQAKSINSVKAYYGIDINKDYRVDYVDYKETYNPKDTNQLRVPSFIHLKVTVYDETILPILRTSVLQYINNSPYLKELFKISRRQKQELIEEIKSEIAKIDSLQRSRFRKGVNAESLQMFYLSNEPGLQLFHDEVLALHYRKQDLERDLEISDEIITVVQDFMPLSQEVYTSTKYMLIFGGSMAILGIFCALFWQFRKRIWELIREDSSKG